MQSKGGVFIDDSAGEHHFPINGKYVPIASVGSTSRRREINIVGKLIHRLAVSWKMSQGGVAVYMMIRDVWEERRVQYMRNI